MKPSVLLKSGFILAFLNSGLTYGQLEKTTAITTSPFSKGNMYLNLSNKLDFSFMKRTTDNESAGNRNKIGLNYSATYFLIDNVGVGIGINSDRNINKFEETEVITSSTVASLHAMYGRELGSVVNIYTKASVRGGRDRERYNYEESNYNQDNKYKQFGVNVEVGMPISTRQQSGFYVTPYIGYDWDVSKDENYKDTYSGIHLGTRLNLSLPCGSFAHNCDQIREFSDNMYTKGTNVIGGHTRFMMNFGTDKNMYTGDNGYEGYDSEYSTSGGSLKSGYYRYLWDDIAVGGDLRIRTSGYKNKDNDNKQNSFSWMFMPKCMVNLPVTGELHNTFGYVGYGIGGSTDKDTDSEETYESKDKKSALEVGAGYNIFFAKGFAVVPVINFAWSASEDTDSGIKSTRSGIEFNFSIMHSF